MLRSFVVLLVAAATSVITARSLDAQLSVTIPRSEQKYDSAAIRAIFAKADTGRMMPGYQNLSAYNTPGFCLTALQRIERLWWRTGKIDTLKRFSSTDTLTTRAREIGRACMANLTLQNVPPLELNNFMQLAVAVNDTALVRAIVDRQLAVAADDRVRGLVVLDVVKTLLTAHPVRKQIAYEYMKRFDSMGSEAKPAAAIAYGTLVAFAHEQFDTSEILRFSREREAVINSLSREQQVNNILMPGQVYLDSIIIMTYKQIPNLQETAERLTARGTAGYPAEAAASTYINYMLPIKMIGEPMQNLSGNWYFPDSIPSQSLQGKVVLLVRMQSVTYPGPVGPHLPMYRRLYERYKDRGFRVVLITQTNGFSWGSPPLAPKDESQTIGWYLREQLKFPFPVVVQETPYRRIADGRRVNGDMLFDMQYGAWGTIHRLLVGRDGKVVMMNPMPYEDQLDAWIRQALEKKAQ
jgi:hypothetical protein